MLPYRQIHLDFHTSGHIPNVGARFDKRQFQEELRRGHVNSVTLFSKCHHGYTYHDTAVGERHPHLVCDLLPLQIEACEEIGVQTPIYISAGYDEVAITKHPEWGVKARDGKTFDPLRAGYKTLCFGTPYLDYLCAQIEEAARLFEGRTPGFFLDIIAARKCHCRWCTEGMQAAGLDPSREENVEAYGQIVLQRYYARATQACRVREPGMRVFHNGGHVPKGAREKFLKWNSHLELESLPTGGWGYDHFPVSAKYAATTGMDYLGMTGKFHQTWGEFGGFKRPEALRYECAAMLTYGSKCSIGDQLHPSGAMNPDTYALIGAAYAEVEAKEPWAAGAENVADIAVVSPESLRAAERLAFFGHGGSPAEEGAARMLLELHAAFDVVDTDADLARYRLVILPDAIPLEPGGAFTRRLAAYLDGGGRLLLSGKSGMTPDGSAFALDLGLTVEGRGAFDPDYLVPTDAAPTPPVRGPFVIHGGAWEVRPDEPGRWRTMAHRALPYFNRTWDHFCSHQHTPDDPDAVSPYPGALTDGRQVAYFAHDIFTRYREYGQPLYRDLVADALAALLPTPTFAVAGMPSAGRAALTRQAAEERMVLHLLYATPIKRGAAQSQWGTGMQSVEVIEDLVPLHGVRCAVRLPQGTRAPRRVTLEPQGAELPFDCENGTVRFTVPEVFCHQMVAVETGGGEGDEKR